MANAPVVSQRPSAQPPRSFHLSRQSLITTTVIALVIIGALVAAFNVHYKKAPTHPYSYSYSKLNSYKLPGEVVGSGVSLSKPVEYEPAVSASPRKDQITFAHAQNKDKKVTLIGNAFLASFHPDASASSTNSTIIGQFLDAFSSKDHKYLVKLLKNVPLQGLGSKFTVSLSSNPQPLTSPNIKTNAFYADFSAVSKDKNQPQLKGKAVVAIGKTSYYIFMIDNTDYNWDNNSAVWQQVIDSLKIDQ